jgi:serine protease DegS
MTRDLAQALALDRPEGVMIRGLQENGPAQRAGVHLRDVIVEISGKPTSDVPQLLARIAELRPGTNARVKVWRDGKLLDVDVVVAKRPKS